MLKMQVNLLKNKLINYHIHLLYFVEFSVKYYKDIYKFKLLLLNKNSFLKKYHYKKKLFMISVIF